MANFQTRIIFSLLVFILIINNIDSQTDDDDGKCGRVNGGVIEGKIIGGSDVGYNKYPWFVVLKHDEDLYCGGTLINRRYILTAAHCYQPFFKQVKQGKTTFEKVLTPVLGVYNVCRSERSQVHVKVSKVWVHEKYEKMDPFFDIALIRLQKQMKRFEPCCLPKKPIAETSRPREANIVGLGVQKFQTNKETCTLREARVLIYNDTTCRRVLNETDGSGNMLQGAFCAGYLKGGIDGCQGDSGGPLTVLGENSRHRLLGITSFGYKCAAPNKLGIYTDVSNFLNWIRDKMNREKPKPTHKPSTTIKPTTIPSSSTTDKPQSSTSNNPTGSGGSTIDWSQFPATPWPSITITFSPVQTLPPNYESEEYEEEEPTTSSSSSEEGEDVDDSETEGPIYVIINTRRNKTKPRNNKKNKKSRRIFDKF